MLVVHEMSEDKSYLLEDTPENRELIMKASDETGTSAAEEYTGPDNDLETGLIPEERKDFNKAMWPNCGALEDLLQDAEEVTLWEGVVDCTGVACITFEW